MSQREIDRALMAVVVIAVVAWAAWLATTFGPDLLAWLHALSR